MVAIMVFGLPKNFARAAAVIGRQHNPPPLSPSSKSPLQSEFVNYFAFFGVTEVDSHLCVW